MKNYEGPVYNKGENNSNKRRFDRSSGSNSSGKFKFEPAYSGKQRQSIDSHSEDIPPTQNEHVEQTEQVNVEQTEQVSYKRGLENYEIPFLKKQNKSLADLRHETEREYREELPEESLFTDEFNSDRYEDIELPSKTERSSYQPAYNPSVDTNQVESQNKQPFKPTELPKPYQKPDTINQRVDENLRLLAKRLQKSKDSFLLFDN